MQTYFPSGFWMVQLLKVLNNSIQKGLMLKRLQKSQDKVVTIWFEENPVLAQEGESVAAALLIAGVKYLRNAQVSGKPRMPYCWMGVCYECLLEIDGEQNQQSCLITVKDGMHVRRQSPAIDEL